MEFSNILFLFNASMTIPTDSSSLDTMAENNKFAQALIGVMTNFKLSTNEDSWANSINLNYQYIGLSFCSQNFIYTHFKCYLLLKKKQIVTGLLNLSSYLTKKRFVI